MSKTNSNALIEEASDISAERKLEPPIGRNPPTYAELRAQHSAAYEWAEAQPCRSWDFVNVPIESLTSLLHELRGASRNPAVHGGSINMGKDNIVPRFKPIADGKQWEIDATRSVAVYPGERGEIMLTWINGGKSVNVRLSKEAAKLTALAIFTYGRNLPADLEGPPVA